MRSLTPKHVHEVLKRFFPAKNDDYECNYAEELKELNDFGIRTDQQLISLLQKRANEVMEIDRSPMGDYDIKLYSEDFGKEFVANRLREGFWFSYPGLLRIALELEYGKSYEDYADRRDRVTESDVAPNSGFANQVGKKKPKTTPT
jgi:hypothetical protein